MASFLGLFIENNLIKYAKVSKEKEDIKVESYGVKFFDNIEETMKQIIEETYSYKTPICVNIANDKYMSSDLISLLNKKDLEKAINIEFDYFCNEKKKNRNATEYRYISVPNIEDKDKLKVLYSYVEKSNIVERLQMLSQYNVSVLTPIATTIGNLIGKQEIQNLAIINLESKTTVTILSNGKPYSVNIIDNGMEEIIKNIAERENSYSKAYEICKNTTIYTMAGQNLQTEENDYLDDIMPTLHQIIEKVKEIINRSEVKVDSIYITGTGAIINNLDLYFQENFMNSKCEILKPFFVERVNVKLNIKDYVEVNSAIAIALEGFKKKADGLINFTNRNAALDSFKEMLTMDVKQVSKKTKQSKSSGKGKLNRDVNINLDFLELVLSRGIAVFLITFIIYIAITTYLTNSINRKTAEANSVITDTDAKIGEITKYKESVDKKKSDYNKLINKIEENEKMVSDANSRRNAIPNFLNQIMFVVPEKVQILSIENTSDKEIKIMAQAQEYQQLGYFKSAIQNDMILTNITSSPGTYVAGLITVEITGELPY